jgi:hypothetical protein
VVVSAQVQPLYVVWSGSSGFQVPATGAIGQNGLPPRTLLDELVAGFAGPPLRPLPGLGTLNTCERAALLRFFVSIMRHLLLLVLAKKMTI